MKLSFVADGRRDEAVLPELVSGIVGRTIDDFEFQPWVRVHSSTKSQQSDRGYDRKLRLSAASARSKGMTALVAVVDRDKDSRGERKQSLSRTVAALVEEGFPLPIAFGVADPHVDVWLLDDLVAVRTGLSLPTTQTIPTVGKVKNPKDELNGLHKASPCCAEDVMDVLRRIAKDVQLVRCNHAEQTGFKAFAESCAAALGYRSA